MTVNNQDIKCNFCSNTFTSNIILDKHTKTAKYCLQLQGKIKKKEKIFKCEDCNVELTSKQTLINHGLSCKAARIRKIKDEEIKELLKREKELLKREKELKRENDELKINMKLFESNYIEQGKLVVELQTKLEIYKDSQECLKEIAKQPKIQQKIQNNNNSVNNKYVYLTPLNLTQEIIKQKIEENFTEKHLIEGQKGVAMFTHDNLLLDENKNLKYLCGDISRLLFYYKNEDGTIEKDPKATNLTKMIAEDVIAKSHNMVMEILDDDTIELLKKLDYQNIFYDIKHLRNDNGKFISNLSLLTSKKPAKHIENDEI